VRARQPHLVAVRRCPDCWLHRTLCLCAIVPRVATRTRVVLVAHQLELRKPTNTGRLAVRCLPNSAVVVRGAGGDSSAPWREAAAPVLLFPHAGAEPLERWRDHPVPVTLVVPDGTWRQATRARRRLPGLTDIPCATLPPSFIDAPRLRRQVRPGRLSTLEAIACALGILEGPAVAEPLTHILRVMVDRTLWSNGRLASALVTGGVPPGVFPHDPVGDQNCE
jgi:tRNA-uridine aminocarboxypropyltransferase